jgi:hypothetical protein
MKATTCSKNACAELDGEKLSGLGIGLDSAAPPALENSKAKRFLKVWEQSSPVLSASCMVFGGA